MATWSLGGREPPGALVGWPKGLEPWLEPWLVKVVGEPKGPKVDWVEVELGWLRLNLVEVERGFRYVEFGEDRLG